MRRSEIFDSFIQKAQEQGLISEAAEQTEKTLDNPRWDSLSIEQISKLYNVKPDRPKDMDYKNNIMEDAHPSPVVIGPSYDKLNALVENNIERQDIIINILDHVPTGQLTQKKYAKKELILSLVRLGNQLDNTGDEEMCALADACLVQATGFEKKALPIIPIAIAALVGVLYAKQHLRFHSDGWTADYQKANKEIEDLLDSNTNFGVGYSYTPQFLQTVNQLKSVLDMLNSALNKVLPVMDTLQQPHTGNELAELSQEPDAQEAAKALEDFKATVAKTYPFIRKIVSDFSNPAYKQRAIAEKGALTSIVDSAEILHGGAGLVADDFDDVVHALQTLMGDVDNIVKSLHGAESVKKQVQLDLQGSESDMASMFGTPATAPKAEAPTEKPEANPLDDVENEANSLLG